MTGKCKCGNGTFIHLIFVLQCDKCGEIQALQENDTTGLSFLVERYTGDNPDNKPGKDVAFIPTKVKGAQ